MRIYVRIQKGASELYEDLASLPPSCRAERLRILASVGLAIMRGGMKEEKRNDQHIAPSGNHQVATKLLQSIAIDQDEGGDE